MGESRPPCLGSAPCCDGDWCSRPHPREKPEPAEHHEPGDLRAGPAAEPARPPPAPSPDEDEYEPARRWPAPPCRRRDERRRVLRLTTEKLAALEENERCLRWEKDLRQQTLLQNMAARLEAEARAERAARQAGRPRGARAYSRTLGRTFGAAPPCGQERRRRRRADDCRLLEVDVQEMFSDIYHQPAPVPIGPLDEDDDAPAKRADDDEAPAKRPRLGGAENADPNAPPAPAPQEQVRFGEEPPLGCAAAAGFADFQHVFHHLVPSLES